MKLMKEIIFIAITFISLLVADISQDKKNEQKRLNDLFSTKVIKSFSLSSLFSSKSSLKASCFIFY